MSDPRPTNPFSTSAVPGAVPAEVDAPPAIQVDARTQQAFLTQAFLWMFVGLAVTAAIAYIVQSNERLLEFAANNLLILIIAQLGIVFAIGLGIRRISATAALGLFFVYAASLGVTMGLIVSAYTQASVATAFVSSSAMFGAAAIYGHVTKRSLARMGSLLFMALIGVLVAMIVKPAAWHAFGLLPAQRELVEQLTREREAVLVSLGVPYALAEYPEAKVRICSYSDVPVSQRAVAGFLVGM